VAAIGRLRQVHHWLRVRLEQIAVRTPPPRRRWWDWALAAGLGALAAVEPLVTGQPWPGWALAAGAVGAVLVPFRRQIPLAAFVLAGAAGTGYELGTILADRPVDDVAFSSEARLVLAYALFRWASPARVTAGMALTVGMLGAAALLAGPDRLEPSRVGFWAGGVGLWAIFGALALAMRYRATLVANQLAAARLAERHALARELHDTVAHHVSAIAVQAQAGQFVAATDPAAATAALRRVEEVANGVIDEMRRVVGLLRRDDDEPPPLSTTTDLERLADPAGTPRVVLIPRDATGVPNQVPVPAPVSTAVYRVAQESVTNARRHGRGTRLVQVILTRHSNHVELEVVNDGTAHTRRSPHGYGLIGMRERVEALDGTFDCGPRPDGGWRTHATIPLRRAS
jgi:signal transduction histidine kinase